MIDALPLMRFLSLRLKPKAAAVPKIGRGPGTEAVPPEVPPLPELPLPPPPPGSAPPSGVTQEVL